MKREKIKLTPEELENFEFATTGYEGDKWQLRGETYSYVDTIRTDEMSDGPSWDVVVKRESDGKYFKWNCWDAGDYNGYMMESGDNYMEQVFPKLKTIYE